MMKNLFLALPAACSVVQAETTLTGAGASFPAPVYRKWTYSYSQAHPGVTVTYQSLGSGAGINQIKEGTVDFAGTDNPLTAEEQEAAGSWPAGIGGQKTPGVCNNVAKIKGAIGYTEYTYALKDYFTWCFTQGAPSAAKLNYVALPKPVAELVAPSL